MNEYGQVTAVEFWGVKVRDCIPIDRVVSSRPRYCLPAFPTFTTLI